ncbi:AtpZ/AtpI family protein [Hippea sp. KM1]|uniref:AtpZ/AtpI family protein n=1 Tax=Hippea sp. KM1 TaxID=944481 RepID=UPI00046C9205|nr:AtpZ/AtpI family protein [Hippea sp. KM1]
MNDRKKRQQKVRFYLELYDATTIGFSVVLSILFGGGLGYWLDKKFNSSHHWLFFLFLAFGIIAGFKNMFYGIRKVDKSLDEDNDKKT